MELWCFLQAFQASRWKYFYFSQVLEALYDLKSGTYSVAGLKERLSETSQDGIFLGWWHEVEELAAQFLKDEQRHDQFHFCFLGQSHYPEKLSQISDPPLALAYEGDIE